MSDLEPSATIGGLGEEGLLRTVFARFAASAPAASPVALGPGDDAAYLRCTAGVLVTTDTMAQGRDWLDQWSSPSDVGAKVVVQNLADIAAMGGVGTGLLVALVAPPSTTQEWVAQLVDGIADAAASAGVQVAGGDLSSCDAGLTIAVTALGELPDGVARPVLRSGARPGDAVAVSGSLGRSAAGLEVLRRTDAGWLPPPAQAPRCAEWVGYHCRPDPDLSQGPGAARAGATAMVDISDGLVRDAGHVAVASGARIRLDSARLEPWLVPLSEVLGQRSALECLLGGGEEHVLLGTFAPEAVPTPWVVVGTVVDPGADAGGDVWLDDAPAPAAGWDHFGGGGGGAVATG